MRSISELNGEGTLPKVVISIINWNDFDNSHECLSSLRKQDYANMSVVVVDNGSRDLSARTLKEMFPEIDLIENPTNLGFSGAFNKAIDRASEIGAKYILCLNNDTVLAVDFLMELVRVGEIRRDAGALSPKEYDYNTPGNLIHAGGKLGVVGSRMRGREQPDTGHYDCVEEAGMLCGAAMMFRVSALTAIGGFDQEYFFTWEDKDIALRLLKSGFKIIYVPTARFWHKRRGSSRGEIGPVTAYFEFRNGLLFARKHYGTLRMTAFVGIFVLLAPASLIARSNDWWLTLKAVILGLVWHVNPGLLPDDAQISHMFGDAHEETHEP